MDIRPVGTTYRQVLQPHPKEADQRPHLITFIVTGHQVIEGQDGVFEVVQAQEKRTLSLDGRQLL